MNYIRRRKIRKLKKEVINLLGVAIMATGLAAICWHGFDKRLTYKECYIYKTRECEGR